jgi:hypothetical protein
VKRAILAVIVLVTLGTFAALACITYPDTRIHFSQGGPYCGEGGHGCTECDSYDQSGDFLSCYSSGGVVTCYGATGGRPYYI